MARKPTGGVVEHIVRDGRTYRALRFTAYGKRRFESLGPVSEGDAQRALRTCSTTLSAGIWRPPQAVEAPPELEPVPTFHEYAEGWWLLNESRCAARTVEDYRWRSFSQGGLIDCFGELPLDKITVDTVESSIAAKLGEDEPLSPRSINMMLTLLAAILDSARERKMIEAESGDRQAPPSAGAQATAQLPRQRGGHQGAVGRCRHSGRQGARQRTRGRVHREALTTVLVFAGLRVSELCDLLWRHVDLAVGWLHVVDSKTDTGVRRVKIRGIVHDALLAIKPVDVDPDAYVFANVES